MKNRDVLISGASVAGPALAYWLHRFGFRPTVVERAPRLRGGGYAVDFRGPVHLEVLRRMGLLDQIRQRQTSLSAMTYVDSEGRPVARMPAEIFAGDLEILRGDLAEVLYDATRDGTEYLFGDSVTTLAEDGGGVHVTFERAAPRTFDLVIGADGLHSAIRRLAFGEEARFRHDLGLYAAIFSTPNFAHLDHAAELLSLPGRTAGLFSARDNAQGIATLYFAGPAPAYDHRDLAQQRRMVAETFAGDGWHVPELLRYMWQAPDFYFDSTSQIRLERWSTGRVALVGDAGYAAGPGGNGTGTAVVAGYVLAGELAAAGGAYRVAFDRYERLLRGYVAGGQKQAAGGTDFLAPATWKKINQRNRFFRMLPYLPVKGLIRWMSSRTAAAVKLPDYRAVPAGVDFNRG